MNLTEYLFTRIRELGVEHTFGIPGDFVLPVYAVQEEFGMPTVVCAHEPGVGFAADGYARFRGLGVAIVTYGPGALNMLNPIACAYAEQSPVLVVSGGPEVALRRPELHLHHVIKTFDSQLKIFREVTVDAAILDDAESAPGVIDRVIARVVRSKRPGYLEIPRDRVRAAVPKPRGRLVVTEEATAARAGALAEAAAEIKAMIAAATQPVLYVGVGVRRHALTDAMVTLAERLRLPVVTDLLGKASFPESHPQFAGIYMSALGDPSVRDLLDGSDCVLGVGVLATDLGTGFWTQPIAHDSRIMISADRTEVRHHVYEDVSIVGMVQALLSDLAPSDRPAPRFGGETSEWPAAEILPGPGNESTLDLPILSDVGPARKPERVIRVADLIAQLGRLDQSRFSFVADVGDSWFIGLELRTDVFVAAGYYSSMGFALPAALGAGLAEPGRRPFVLVGDGAFQMTGTELSTLVDQGVRPIVLLINNGGYGMLEAVDGPRKYYERRHWDYQAFARSLGAEAERARTREELASALDRAQAARGAYVIEAMTARDDFSPVMSRIRAHFKKMRLAPAAL